jgi:hypothetical protein
MKERDFSLAYNCGRLKGAVEALQDITWLADDSDDLPTELWDQITSTATTALMKLWLDAMKHCSDNCKKCDATGIDPDTDTTPAARKPCPGCNGSGRKVSP